MTSLPTCHLLKQINEQFQGTTKYWLDTSLIPASSEQEPVKWLDRCLEVDCEQIAYDNIGK